MRYRFLVFSTLLGLLLAVTASGAGAQSSAPSASSYPPSALDAQRARHGEIEKQRAAAKKALRQSRTRQWTGSGTSKPDVNASDFVGATAWLGPSAAFDAAIAALLLGVAVTTLTGEPVLLERSGGGGGSGAGAGADVEASTTTSTSTATATN